jgi:dUTP pyrophosphatase
LPIQVLTIKINIKNIGTAPLPSYQTALAAGADIYANNLETISIQPFERALVPTGFILELPEGFEAQIRPRSGLALKHGITVLNSPGTIDADYRGEVKVLLINLGQTEFTINHGDRIAQMVIARCEQADWQTEIELSTTSRGEGGYGHTGI